MGSVAKACKCGVSKTLDFRSPHDSRWERAFLHPMGAMLNWLGVSGVCLFSCHRSPVSWTSLADDGRGHPSCFSLPEG